MKMITVLVAVAVAVMALTTTASAKEVSCNAGFVLIRGTSCIKVFTEKVTWQEASDACKSIDNYTPGSPHLAYINDCSLLAGLWDYIHYQLRLETTEQEDFWLGGSDSHLEGEWEWETGDAVPTGIPYWYPYQPDGGKLENKLVLAHNGYFADAHEDDRVGYICQYTP